MIYYFIEYKFIKFTITLSVKIFSTSFKTIYFMRSHLLFQIVSAFFPIGVFAGLRYHDFISNGISRFFQMDFA